MSEENTTVENVESNGQPQAEQKPRKQPTRYNVSPEDFIKAFQESNSPEEVSEKVNMPVKAVMARASAYRKQRKDGRPGIPLKYFPRKATGGGGGARLDLDNLRHLAESLAPAGSEEEVSA